MELIQSGTQASISAPFTTYYANITEFSFPPLTSQTRRTVESQTECITLPPTSISCFLNNFQPLLNHIRTTLEFLMADNPVQEDTAILPLKVEKSDTITLSPRTLTKSYISFSLPHLGY